jgi:hypothetical protein
MRLKVNAQLVFPLSSIKPPKDFCQRYIVQKPPASTARWLFVLPNEPKYGILLAVQEQ